MLLYNGDCRTLKKNNRGSWLWWETTVYTCIFILSKPLYPHTHSGCVVQLWYIIYTYFSNVFSRAISPRTHAKESAYKCLPYAKFVIPTTAAAAIPTILVLSHTEFLTFHWYFKSSIRSYLYFVHIANDPIHPTAPRTNATSISPRMYRVDEIEGVSCFACDVISPQQDTCGLLPSNQITHPPPSHQHHFCMWNGIDGMVLYWEIFNYSHS